MDKLFSIEKELCLIHLWKFDLDPPLECLMEILLDNWLSLFGILVWFVRGLALVNSFDNSI